ncbi:hypothetical protein [Tumebacillus permanentifrigoris]|uniref:Uncharacterized protein n=1 Tax=Tumebacillus permanentifrigoris TaxID=378543 RepID=A0A316D4G8_9BACL|nr:hypothetical protein [Tumebacillus permanentifrigoris]PWK03964.1 hypothetical protein C7459_1364 [Tumebacillus permanentifrigoris]
MENMDGKLISIFATEPQHPALRESMRDLSKLAGVIGELGEADYFLDPSKTFQIIRVLHILNEEALGLTSLLEDEKSIFYRYRNLYEQDPTVDIKRIVFILGKYNWIYKGPKRITMMDVGKRMMDTLIRLANDSLAYYMQDEVTRSLFQARRDAEISEAYDDKGISGGNRLASMIRNIEEAVSKLQERELEYLADRNALPQVEVIHGMMQDLSARLNERIAQFSTFEEGLRYTPLIQKGTGAMLKGTQVSLGTLHKILRFSHLQTTPVGEAIQHDSLRTYMRETYHQQLHSDLPDPHQILSFMEQDLIEGERLDGLWVPVKFASPIPGAQLAATVQFLEEYQPILEPLEEVPAFTFEPPLERSEAEIAELVGESNWQLTKSQIDTEQMEQYLQQVQECSLEQLVLETGSEKWGDAINALTSLSAFIGHEKAQLIEPTDPLAEIARPSVVNKEWELSDDQDRRKRVRRTN